MLLYLYQIFILLLGHLHFFLPFFFMLLENLIKKHPIHGPILPFSCKITSEKVWRSKKLTFKIRQ